jgi:hypothetical protein
MKHILFILLLPLLINASCKKTVTPNPTPAVEQLPPATQEGKNTFGCLINGNIWVPYKTDFSRKLEVWYDPTYRNGSLRIIAERKKESVDQSITIAIDSLDHLGYYSLNFSGSKIYYDDVIRNCIYDSFDTSVFKMGKLNITKLDHQNRIIAGTFEFTLFKSGCDTIKATEGRFDVKF